MHPHHNRYGATRGEAVVPGRLELPTSTLSVWRSNRLSYRTPWTAPTHDSGAPGCGVYHKETVCTGKTQVLRTPGAKPRTDIPLQKGGVPAAPSGTATLLRLSPNHRFYPRAPLAVTHFRYPRLSWLDGRCVQGPGTYSPRHG